MPPTGSCVVGLALPLQAHVTLDKARRCIYPMVKAYFRDGNAVVGWRLKCTGSLMNPEKYPGIFPKVDSVPQIVADRISDDLVPWNPRARQSTCTREWAVFLPKCPFTLRAFSGATLCLVTIMKKCCKVSKALPIWVLWRTTYSSLRIS